MAKTQNEQLASPIQLPLIPFLKWAGGKRWLAPIIEKKFGQISGRYIEPFLGGGAVFFRLQPRQALLNDTNADLINAYQAIKDNHELVAKHLNRHQRLHSSEHYYLIRRYAPRCVFRRAARFIYLNRTCWNGLYRVNLNGVFNVPIGTKSSVVLPSDNWGLTARSLKSALLTSSDFECVIDQADKGDLVFADPPYTIKHNHNGFVKYNESLFSWADQERLCLALWRAKKRGAVIVATNANHESVRALYKDKFNLATLERSNVLSGNPKYRGKFQELLIGF